MALFKHIFFYSLLCGISMACNNKSQTIPVSTTINQIKDTIITDTLSSFSDVLELPAQGILLDTSSLVRANGYLFAGKIDRKYAIEMALTPTKVPSENCESLSGSYAYTTSDGFLSLDGKICLNEQKIYLQHHNEQGLDEYFEGTFDANTDSVQGFWQKTKTQQSLHFELHKVLNQENAALFTTALSSILSEDAEAPSAQDIGFDEQGIYIQNLDGPHLDYNFQPGHFSASSYYSSTMRTSMYNIEAYLKKLSIRDAYVAVAVYEHDNEYYEEGKGDETEVEMSKEVEYSVWMYQDNEIVDIFVSKESEAQQPIYATLKGDALVIIDQISQKKQRL